MEQWWFECDSEALTMKDSQAATIAFIKLYEQISPEERTMADQLIGEWARSDQDRRRFDALAVIDHCRVRAAAPQLRALEADLRARVDPRAPFELKKVSRILRRLENED